MTPSEPHTIDTIIKMIQQNEIRIPIMQRPFVWSKKQIEKLFQSIFIGDIIGSISTLKTTTDYLVFESRKFEPNIETNITTAYEKEFEEKFTNIHPLYLVLDGQQRLQSIYCGLIGHYSDKELYFDKTYSIQNNETAFKFFKSNPDKKRWVSVNKLYECIKNNNNCNNAISKYSDGKNKVINENIFKFFYSIVYKPTILFLVSEPQKLDLLKDKQRFSELFVKLNTAGTYIFTPEAFVCKIIGIKPELKSLFEQMKIIGDTVLLQNEKYYLVNSIDTLPLSIQHYHYEYEILFIIFIYKSDISFNDLTIESLNLLANNYLDSNCLINKDKLWIDLKKYEVDDIFISNLIEYIEQKQDDILRNYIVCCSFGYLKTLFTKSIYYKEINNGGIYNVLSPKLYIPFYYKEEFTKNKKVFITNLTNYFIQQILIIYHNFNEITIKILIYAHLHTNETALSFISTDNILYKLIFWIKPFLLEYDHRFEQCFFVKPSEKNIMIKKIVNKKIYNPKHIESYDDIINEKWAQKLIDIYLKKIEDPTTWQSNIGQMFSWVDMRNHSWGDRNHNF